MKSHPTDVETIMADLEVCVAQLQAECVSPSGVRRLFQQFLKLSQQLTEMMRREFKKDSGRRWEASKFNGWDAVSELMKALRTADMHRAVIRLQVGQEVVRKLPIDADIDVKMKISGVWSSDNTLADRPPGKLGEQLAKREEQGVKLEAPEGTKYWFVIKPVTRKVERRLDGCGNNNVHLLAEQYYQTLRAYHTYYVSELSVSC